MHLIAFGLQCREANVRPSTGAIGDANDNALCERFFATLECELIHRRRFEPKAAARMAIFEFIEGWYNPRRRHSSIAYHSPWSTNNVSRSLPSDRNPQPSTKADQLQWGRRSQRLGVCDGVQPVRYAASKSDLRGDFGTGGAPMDIRTPNSGLLCNLQVATASPIARAARSS